jgi:hypothetical protein
VIRLMTFFISVVGFAAVVWFGVTVELGQRTLFGHLRAIGGSNEAQELWAGTKEKVTDFVGIEAARRAEAAKAAFKDPDVVKRPEVAAKEEKPAPVEIVPAPKPKPLAQAAAPPKPVAKAAVPSRPLAQAKPLAHSVPQAATKRGPALERAPGKPHAPAHKVAGAHAAQPR